MSENNQEAKEERWIPEFVRFLKTKGTVNFGETMSQSPMQVMAGCLAGTSKHAGIPLPNPALMMAAAPHPSRPKSYSIDSILGDIVTRRAGNGGESGPGSSTHPQLQLYSWVTRPTASGSASPRERYSPDHQQSQPNSPNTGKFIDWKYFIFT